MEGKHVDPGNLSLASTRGRARSQVVVACAQKVYLVESQALLKNVLESEQGGVERTHPYGCLLLRTVGHGLTNRSCSGTHIDSPLLVMEGKLR